MPRLNTMAPNKFLDWREKEGVLRRLKPDLSPEELTVFRNIIKGVSSGIAQSSRSKERQSLCEETRALLSKIQETASTELMASLSVIADLFEQGWTIHDADDLIFEPPGNVLREGEKYENIKDRIRDYLKSGQNRQLEENSVQQFMSRMFRVTSRPEGRHSIASIIDDGKELAKVMSAAAALSEDEREIFLSKHIKPELELCDTEARCKDTGLKLLDIWRFFRHTWLTEYRPIPGRQMPILIRNAARKNRPVMGIAMLASPVMRLGIRDKWIGWDTNSVIDRLFDGKIEHSAFINSLYERVNSSIQEIRWDDLTSEESINSPTPKDVDALDRLAVQANHRRQDALRSIAEDEAEDVKSIKDPDLEVMTDDAWRELSEDDLYVEKRANVLASLLRAKMALADFNLLDEPKNLRRLVTTKNGMTALEAILSEFRKDGMANNVMDVSVCGAVPPYGGLLVGKLVTLLLLSSEVDEIYRARYGSKPRIIASQMAGRPIIKPTSLKVLTTTSLFGVGTSQYNRLRLKASDFHGIPFDLEWEKLGEHSAGYGTIHLSSTTQDLLRRVAIKKHGARRINSRFGEGTSARLRQAREGLDALGMESNSVLHHANPRIVLGCKAEANTELSLLGLTDPKSKKRPTTKSLARAWRRRWLLQRVCNPVVQQRVASEGLKPLQDFLLRQPESS